MTGSGKTLRPVKIGSEGCDGSIIVWGEDCVSSDCLADGSGTPIAATLAYQMEPRKLCLGP